MNLIDTIFEPASILATSLLALVLVYWLTVIFGLLDMETFDIDLEVDPGIDVDMDLDLDIGTGASSDGIDLDLNHGMDAATQGGNAEGSVSWMNKALYFVNMGKVPFMVWLTFFVVPLWFITIFTNQILGFTSFLPGLLVFGCAFVASVFLAKLFTWPLVKVFKKLEGDSMKVDLTGAVGKVTLTIFAGSSGKIELRHSDRHYALYARALDDKIEIAKGTQVLVIKKMAGNKETYLVEPYNY